MRAFFGLSPDPVTKLAIQEWRDKTLPQFNAPVPTANFHVTLAFLGQINPRQLDALCSEIDSLKENPEFTVHLNQVGYWPKPKAFWLGCGNTAPAHVQLATNLYKTAKQVGLNLPKRDYVAHLTLARKCSFNPPSPLIQADFSWKAEAFHLFESVSSNHGVSYHIKHSWPLKKTFSFS